MQAHLPWLTEGGIDVKVGQYPDARSATRRSTPRPIRSTRTPTSSISACRQVHTGVQTVTHVNDVLDVYAGVDTGMNTTFGAGENNGAVAGLAGVNLTLLDGKLTILALSHFGPENPTRSVPKANCCWRSENDVVITYKHNDKLSFVTDLN